MLDVRTDGNKLFFLFLVIRSAYFRAHYFTCASSSASISATWHLAAEAWLTETTFKKRRVYAVTDFVRGGSVSGRSWLCHVTFGTSHMWHVSMSLVFCYYATRTLKQQHFRLFARSQFAMHADRSSVRMSAPMRPRLHFQHVDSVNAA